jgi:hypothetical protein
MNEDSWQQVRLSLRTVNVTREPVREDKHAQKIRLRSWMLDTIRTPMLLI